MSYYMTLYSLSERCPSVDAIEVPLFSDFDADYSIEKGDDDDWREITFCFDGEEDSFATLCRVTVDSPDGLPYIEAALGDIEDGEPASAVTWLKAYLSRVKAIYTFAIDDDRGLPAIRAVQHGIWLEVGGVKQADMEGFSNDEDFHILWQFTDKPRSQPWQMAVLDGNGQWLTFEMDLGRPDHVAAFRAGRVPDGVPTR